MFHASNRCLPRRRGAVLLLTVFLMVFLIGIIAFAVDIGYVLVAKTQVQNAADAAALAAGATMVTDTNDSMTTGKQIGGMNKVGNKNVVLKDSDFVFGTWDTATRTFAPSQNGLSNAVKVTARADDSTSGAVPLFFGAVFDQHSVNVKASAIATCNPRDICFVVDLSSSMNDDTDPANTASLNASFPGVGSQMMQKYFDDLNFGTYPGPTYTGPKVGAPLGCTAISGLTNTTSSPLLYSKKAYVQSQYSYTVPSQYLIYVAGDGSGKPADSSANRTKKAYSWVIDEQLGGKSGAALSGLGIMRNAKPNLDSSNSSYYTYWKAYIDATPSNLGYLSYVKIIEPCGRDGLPFSGTSSLLSPASVDAPYYVHHTESTDAGNFEFPAGEMPTHSARRSLISAIKVIADRNQNINAGAQQDWVAIVTYYNQSNVKIEHNLNVDYQGAMQASATLQSCGVATSCTATETGLMQAIALFDAQGRKNANKVVVLLTDGKPNLYSSSNTAISNYRNAHGNSNFYGGTGSYPQDAAMIQASIMQGKNWMFFPVELGLAGDGDFMNRIYSIGKGKTGSTDISPYAATGNPANYEAELKKIFVEIISSPKVRLVQ
jgi:Flp pilus assembly protein TadG